MIFSANRLVGDLPKIGIRPTIDGRMKGVRESLEDQTYKMALKAKEIIETLRHPSGEKTEWVIAKDKIGDVKKNYEWEVSLDEVFGLRDILENII